MDFLLNYGKGTVSLSIPEKNHMAMLMPKENEYNKTGADSVVEAIENPIGSAKLRTLVSTGEKIVVVTSDITRPVPSYLVLPSVIEELTQGGVNTEDITIVLALGSHRGHTEEEKRALVGDAIYESEISIIDSDMGHCVNLGSLHNGTPADIFEPVAAADRRICIGNIEFHYFAGYSGGCKALMPGVSSYEAIQKNHSNMVDARAHAGNLAGNPVREDIDQINDLVPIDFIVNVVLDEKKRIVHTVAGHPIEAHRAGCHFLDMMYKIPIEAKADIVVVSPGGYPKDINIYQSQKGLDNSKHAVKEGGTIIWCASAAEGFGEKTFESWMLDMKPKEMISEIKRNFKLGGHKAAAISMILESAEVYMVSDLPKEIVSGIGMVPFETVQSAYDAALSKHGDNARTIVMPAAGSVLPHME